MTTPNYSAESDTLDPPCKEVPIVPARADCKYPDNLADETLCNRLKIAEGIIDAAAARQIKQGLAAEGRQGLGEQLAAFVGVTG